MPIYVKLFHGRNDPNQNMDDWGEQGPVFGPLDWFHTTYLNHIRMGDAENDDQELKLVGDMLYYDGMYYGDWSAFGEEEIMRCRCRPDNHDVNCLSRYLQKYDPAKATPPVEPQSDSVILKLARNDAGQILDGIRERKRQWDDTVLNFQGALQAEDDTVVCECSDEDEAQKIATHYGELIEQLEAQL